MTDQRDLTLLVARANPVDDPHDIAESLDLRHELLSLIEERSTDMTTTKRVAQLDRQSKSVRPVAAFAAALAVLLLIIGGSTLLLSRSTPEGEPADITPPTTQPEAATVTTVASPATTTPITVPAQSESVISWVAADLPTEDDFPHVGSVAFSNGRYVAAGAGIWHSSDLLVWNAVTDDAVAASDSVEIPLDELEGQVVGGPQGFLVTYSGGYFVFEDGARGLAAVFVSQDGVTWTQSEIREPEEWDSLYIEAAVAGGPGWVAVGHIGGSEGRIWVSEDGLTWDSIVLPEFDGVTLNYVSESNGTLTVAGTAGDRFARGADARSWTSQDGRTWEPAPRTNQPVHPATHSIAVNPTTGHHVAMSVHGVWTSTNGIEWQLTATDNGTPPYTHPTEGAVWIGDTVIGVQRYQDWIYESSDGGITWFRSHPVSHPENESIGPHRFFVHNDVVLATVGGLWIGTPE